jgi:hypothetical protein
MFYGLPVSRFPHSALFRPRRLAWTEKFVGSCFDRSFRRARELNGGHSEGSWDSRRPSARTASASISLAPSFPPKPRTICCTFFASVSMDNTHELHRGQLELFTVTLPVVAMRTKRIRRRARADFGRGNTVYSVQHVSLETVAPAPASRWRMCIGRSRLTRSQSIARSRGDCQTEWPRQSSRRWFSPARFRTSWSARFRRSS